MPLWRETARGLTGAWRLMLRDRGAMRWFDCSVPGVWRSFWSAVLCYPGFLVLLWLRLAPSDIAQAGLGRIALVETIGYVIGWVAYPLLALPFCRWLASEERALGFVGAYNWSQTLQMVVLLLVEAVSHALPLSAGAAAFLQLATYLALLVYEWFIARIALDQGGLPATTLVLLDVVLGAALSVATQGLY